MNTRFNQVIASSLMIACVMALLLLSMSFFVMGATAEESLEFAEPTTPAPPMDTDGDGIYDRMDRCPSVPGEARYFGCPAPK